MSLMTSLNNDVKQVKHQIMSTFCHFKSKQLKQFTLR